MARSLNHEVVIIGGGSAGIAEAIKFWHLAVDVAKFQHQRGLGFVIEHPMGASSWSDSYIEGIW